MITQIKKYRIQLDSKTTATVNEQQIVKPSWVAFFGSLEAVENFIQNYHE